MKAFDRVKLMVGSDGYEKLKSSKVAIFGIGGVGGFTAEALARSGVGCLAIFDADIVSETNINRQIIATTGAVGKDKVDVMKERLLAINPQIKVDCYKVFYLPENSHEFDLSEYDYIVDAVDTVSAKIELIMQANAVGVPVISCMGTGGKLDVSGLKVGKIEQTKGCPLARVMRRELKKRGVQGVKVVYSEEQVAFADGESQLKEKKGKDRTAPPSMIFVPATAGLMLAREVVTEILSR